MAGETQRRQAILAVADRLLVERGYAATSMLQIAKAAKASNETLYRLWPNKQALFRELVADNARKVTDAVIGGDAAGAAPWQVLERMAPLLLETLTGASAIALNRAAAADQAATATLGPALAEEGRARVLPVIEAVMARAIAGGDIVDHSPAEAAELYVTLLVGDLQIRLVTGALAGLEPAAIAARAAAAFARFRRLAGRPD